MRENENIRGTLRSADYSIHCGVSFALEEPWGKGASSTAEAPLTERVTVSADKTYDPQDFVAAREVDVPLHAQKNEKGRQSTIDRRTTRHSEYARSLSRRWLVEKTVGWLGEQDPYPGEATRLVPGGLDRRFQLRRPPPAAPSTPARDAGSASH